MHMYTFLTTIWEGDSGVIPVSPRLRAGEEYADVGAVSGKRNTRYAPQRREGPAQGAGMGLRGFAPTGAAASAKLADVVGKADLSQEGKLSAPPCI